jgi:Polyketide cyclase / dehydrase and lipid transport
VGKNQLTNGCQINKLSTQGNRAMLLQRCETPSPSGRRNKKCRFPHSAIALAINRRHLQQFISFGETPMIELLNVTKTINADADQAWAAISSIGGLDRWFPIITSCTVSGTGEGTTHILTLADGSEIKDRIEAIDHQYRSLRYIRTESPFPVQSYLGAVDVRYANEGTAEVSWTVEIDVQKNQRDALVEFLRNALTGGIMGLEQDLHQPHMLVN